MALPQSAKRQIDWIPIREAFIKRPAKPTYDELSEEFGINYSTIANTCADEGWPVLRAQFLDAQLQSSGAKEIILNALSCAKAIVDSASTFGLVMFQQLTGIIQDQKLAGLAPSTRAEVLNTASFAAANTSRAMKELGVVGFAKALNDSGREGNHQWNPEMLTQINLTVQNMQSKDGASVSAKAEPVSVIANEPTKEAPKS